MFFLFQGHIVDFIISWLILCSVFFCILISTGLDWHSLLCCTSPAGRLWWSAWHSLHVRPMPNTSPFQYSSTSGYVKTISITVAHEPSISVISSLQRSSINQSSDNWLSKELHSYLKYIFFARVYWVQSIEKCWKNETWQCLSTTWYESRFWSNTD